MVMNPMVQSVKKSPTKQIQENDSPTLGFRAFFQGRAVTCSFREGIEHATKPSLEYQWIHAWSLTNCSRWAFP